MSVGKEWEIPLRQTQKLNAKDSEAKKSQVPDNIAVPEKKRKREENAKKKAKQKTRAT